MGRGRGLRYDDYICSFYDCHLPNAVSTCCRVPAGLSRLQQPLLPRLRTRVLTYRRRPLHHSHPAPLRHLLRAFCLQPVPADLLAGVGLMPDRLLWLRLARPLYRGMYSMSVRP
jgi:hypothetical protein